MVMPTRAQIHPVLLRSLWSAGGSAAPQDMVDSVTAHFRSQLTEADLEAKQLDGRSSMWRNRVHWARMDLVISGYIDNSIRGVWSLTPEGADFARTAQPAVPQPRNEPVTDSPRHAQAHEKQAVQTMLLALLQEVTNAELPWTMEHLDDGSVALSYDGRLRVILRP